MITDLKWTKQRPREPGWYWHARDKNAKPYLEFVAMYETEMTRGQQLWCMNFGFGGMQRWSGGNTVADEEGVWCGPLECPPIDAEVWTL